MSELSPRLSNLAKEFPKFFGDGKVLMRASCPIEARQNLHKPSIAIVGTRHPTPYGERCCRRLVAQLSEWDVNVVSGGAMGIDRIVHEECLKRSLPTHAWVVGPIERPSPGSNRRLFERILETRGSSILTPLCLEPSARVKIQKSFWILRNHWLVASADVLVIVEALEKSGTWSTVKAAASYHSDAYAFPGNIDSPQSSGTNSMILNGYAKIFDLKEILTNSLLVPAFENSYNLVKRREAQNGSEDAKAVAQTTQSNAFRREEFEVNELLATKEGAKKVETLLSSGEWGLGGGRLFRKE